MLLVREDRSERTAGVRVVRISDIIGYIGRDIEDAIHLGVLTREEIPSEITDVLGNTNTDIVNTIVTDIIDNSFGKSYIKMSNEVYEALGKLKQFNYEYIYQKCMTSEERVYYRAGMERIFVRYLKAIEEEDRGSVIYEIFLNDQAEEYLESTSAKRMVIDFIAGMTDDLLFVTDGKGHRGARMSTRSVQYVCKEAMKDDTKSVIGR